MDREIVAVIFDDVRTGIPHVEKEHLDSELNQAHGNYCVTDISNKILTDFAIIRHRVYDR